MREPTIKRTSQKYMQIIYPDTPITEPSDLYLAGPTPRDPDVLSWRIEALDILNQNHFPGIVCVPERESWKDYNYIDQVEWEYKGLQKALKIIFWVPRDLKTLPGLTTNVEFGYWLALRPHNVYYGRPINAPKTRYLDWLYQKHTGHQPKDTLQSLLMEALI